MYDEYMAAPSVRHTPLLYQANSPTVIQVLFETGVIWFAEKRKHWRPVWNPELQEDLTNAAAEEIVRLFFVAQFGIS